MDGAGLTRFSLRTRFGPRRVVDLREGVMQAREIIQRPIHRHAPPLSLCARQESSRQMPDVAQARHLTRRHSRPQPSGLTAALSG